QGVNMTNSHSEATTRKDIVELHTFQRWPALHLLPMIVSGALLSLAAAWVWETPAYRMWLLLICPALGYVMFLFVLAFHDASHNRLHPVYWLNETYGHFVGTFSLVPLSVYRHAHAYHHAYLGSERDPELWPFNTPGTSRPVRVLAAILEIVLGVVYTPILFLRDVVVSDLSQLERRRIVLGYVACVLFWAGLLSAVHYLDKWKLFLVAGLIPMAISALLQTLNKFTQHLGLHGTTVLGLTRTVVDKNHIGMGVSSTMFYNDYHGTHHRYAKIPYYNLPPATPYTLATAREFCPVFSSIFSAGIDMLFCLGNPKVGPQWGDTEPPPTVTDSNEAKGMAYSHPPDSENPDQ
ncbi:MAG: fatty acid desaturase, partial [Planctomycetaceae bacterium]|nr:fatty acid desaturase [Planctomycetaceae bacterium]